MADYGGAAPPAGEEYDDAETPRRGLADKTDVKALAKQLLEWSQSENIAFDIDPQRLSVLGQECVFGYEIDTRSRTEWEKRSKDFMDLALQRRKPKTFPWPNASNVCWPLLSQAVNEFAESIYPTVMDGDRVVKGRILGSDKGTVDQAKAQQILAMIAQQAQQQPQLPAPGGNPQQSAPNPMQNGGTPPQMPGAPPMSAPGASGLAQGTPGVPQQAPAPPPIPYVPGKEPGAKRRRADKVSEHMSWQLLSEQTEWQTDSDQLFRALPIIGCGARKSWFDPVWGRNCSMYVSMMDLVVNYKAKTLETAPRVTEVFELYPYEIEEKIRADEFIDFKPGMAIVTEEQGKDDGDKYASDKYAPHLFLEQHCFWDLDGDDLDEPYIVTIHKATQKVVRVKARYEAEGIRLNKKQTKIAKIEPVNYYTLFQFMPNPESAIYGHGFGHILGPINESLNSAINQLFDAGTLANLQSGFVGSGLTMHSGAIRLKMGQFIPVNTTGGSVRDSIYMPDFKGPSIVMFQMFGLLVEAGRQLAGIGNVSSGQQSPASTDPATMMAMIEQGTKVFRGVYKRVCRGLNTEYGKLFDLNRKHMPEQGFQWQRADEQFEVTADDYAQCAGVETVGDPSLVTDIQRLARAQLLERYKDDPRCNGVEILRRIFQAANIEDIDAVLIENPQLPPLMQAQLQKLQAELASEFATQQKNRAQSVLFLMQAKKFAAEADAAGQSDLLDQQLEREWVEIERNNSKVAALNTTIKAHEIALRDKQINLDHHAEMTGHRVAHAANQAKAKNGKAAA